MSNIQSSDIKIPVTNTPSRKELFGTPAKKPSLPTLGGIIHKNKVVKSLFPKPLSSRADDISLIDSLVKGTKQKIAKYNNFYNNTTKQPDVKRGEIKHTVKDKEFSFDWLAFTHPDEFITNTSEKRKTIFFSHGNGHSISAPENYMAYFYSHGYNVVATSYRDLLRIGSYLETKKALKDTSKNFIKEYMKDNSLNYNDTIYVNHSLGTGVSSHGLEEVFKEEDLNPKQIKEEDKVYAFIARGSFDNTKQRVKESGVPGAIKNTVLKEIDRKGDYDISKSLCEISPRVRQMSFIHNALDLRTPVSSLYRIDEALDNAGYRNHSIHEYGLKEFLLDDHGRPKEEVEKLTNSKKWDEFIIKKLEEYKEAGLYENIPEGSLDEAIRPHTTPHSIAVDLGRREDLETVHSLINKDPHDYKEKNVI